ncbi:F-box/LRR-repeat protein 25-like [Senna tora]|uniref:F-box/LRR-repeat protein 25-like n=1 Tax=Senna tora TaxID=362788 RepID=A0A834XC61_9FABA|nr:F-box/LRR-repeat protein 25-like [Senna tora]
MEMPRSYGDATELWRCHGAMEMPRCDGRELEEKTVRSERMTSVSFSQKSVLQKLNVDYVECCYVMRELGYKYLIDMFGAVGGTKFVILSERTIRALSKFPDVVKGKQYPFSGIEELKIIIRCSENLSNNFSFTVPNSVITYLLSSSPSKGRYEAFFPMFCCSELMDLKL